MNIERIFILAKTAAIRLTTLAAVVLTPGCGLLDALDAHDAHARRDPRYGSPFDHRSSESERHASGYRTASFGSPIGKIDPGKIKIKPGAFAK